MEVRLFQIGGHEYVFRFGVFCKPSETKTNVESCPEKCEAASPIYKGRRFGKKTSGGKKVNVITPTNKYAYSRRNISSNLGLKRYKKIMTKMPEILDVIPEFPEKSKKVADKINKANILENFELLSHMLNMFARISDGTQFRDTKGKPWKLIAEGWGQFTTIHKQEAL